MISNVDGAVEVTNSILWGSNPDMENPMQLKIEGIADIRYCNIDQDGYGNADGSADADGNIRLNPLFVDSANGDFRLMADSPCIDTGTGDGAPPDDIVGILRPQGAGFDMGAYEHVPPIFPSQGTMGTVITITGEDFGSYGGDVRIGGSKTKIIEWSESHIICRAIKNLHPGAYDVQVIAKGKQAIVLETGFVYLAPEITAIDTNGGSAGDEIFIMGKYFGNEYSKLKVYLFNKENNAVEIVTLDSWQMDSCTFIVPDIEPGDYNLYVINLVDWSAPVNFAVVD